MGYIMGGLTAEAYDRNYRDRDLVRRIIGYFRAERGAMLVVALMVVIQSLADTGMPIVISRSINLLEQNPSLSGLMLLAAGALLLGILAWSTNFVRQVYTARAVSNVVLELRKHAFDALMRRDLSFYDSNPLGKIISRVTSDTEDFTNVVTLTMNLLSQLLLVVIFAVVLLVINWRLALIAIVIVPVVFIVALSYRRFARYNMRKAARMTANVNNIIQETISGIAVAKNFRQEQAIYDDFSATNRQAYRVLLFSNLSVNTIFSVLDMIGGIGIASIVYFGGVQVLGGTVSLGDWYLFVQSLAIFLSPVASVAAFWSQFQQGLAASERVFALIDTEPKVIQTDHQPVERLDGRVEFRNVRFGYKEGEVVLPNFSLLIPAGQTVALVGHTGAGKSSLGRLLARFYEFQGGSILVDGRDIRTFDEQQYRRCLGIVPQVPFLFSGTVADNIRYGRPEASDAEIERVARMIGGGAWLENLSKGLATQAGERGAYLSMGQRQLVAMARVLLQNPAICILDEATASIDLFTEAQIQEGLDIVLEGRTSLVIAHRLSTIWNADRIVVMREGQIIEEGTHATLLASGGHYAELYNMYFRHQSLDYIEHVGEYRARVPA
jgi:ABC-type multidrug transport system fused ATPase/permease subunit